MFRPMEAADEDTGAAKVWVNGSRNLLQPSGTMRRTAPWTTRGPRTTPSGLPRSAERAPRVIRQHSAGTAGAAIPLPQK
eukprot:13996997-Heterocapsa_arctica.AAC.1